MNLSVKMSRPKQLKEQYRAVIPATICSTVVAQPVVYKLTSNQHHQYQ